VSGLIAPQPLFSRVKPPSPHWTEHWVDFGVGLEAVEERKTCSFCPESNPNFFAVKAVDRRLTGSYIISKFHYIMF
jgi:hypothetical protein